jgi:hypothetical protein
VDAFFKSKSRKGFSCWSNGLPMAADQSPASIRKMIHFMKKRDSSIQPTPAASVAKEARRCAASRAAAGRGWLPPKLSPDFPLGGDHPAATVLVVLLLRSKHHRYPINDQKEEK